MFGEIESKMDDEWVSIYRFRMIAGCDKAAVEKAIEQGYFGDAVKKNDDGKIRIHKTQGRANWARNWRDTATATPKLREFLRSAPKPAAAKPAADPWKDLSMSESRRIEAATKAQQSQLALQVKLGKLVDVEDVKAAQFELVQIIRRELEVLPSQIAAKLGIDHAGQHLMETEIGKKLSKLADLDGIEFAPRVKRGG